MNGFTLPETNSKFAPENGWLEYVGIRVLVSFGDGLFAGAFAVSFREGISHDTGDYSTPAMVFRYFLNLMCQNVNLKNVFRCLSRPS